MEIKSKADRFIKEITKIIKSDSIDVKWFFGNDTDDPLRYAFDSRRSVHPFVKGKPIPKEEWQVIWNKLMEQKGQNKKRVAYIHIPFCQTRCLYCGFFQNFSNKELEDAYIDRLIKELRMSSESIFVKSHPFQAVYIGGGTPSALSSKNIEKLLKAINTYLPLANDCEFTFEARFYEFDDEKIQVCLEGGINRFSFGVQSFDTEVRRSVGRIHNGEEVLEKLKYIHNLGRAVVVIDLIYGLPGQTMEIWEKDVQTLIESGIDGGDLYQLIVYEDSKLKEKIEKGDISPAASIPEQAIMFKKGVEIMEARRMRRLSVSHWAANTRERNIYNSFVVSGADMLPFGAGAGGRLGRYTMFIDRGIKNYMDRIDKGEKPIMFMVYMPEEYQFYSEIIGQMDRGYLDLSSFKSQYNVDLAELLSPLLEAWKEKGLIEINGDYIDLTIAGQFWYINLTQAMLDWLSALKEKIFN